MDKNLYDFVANLEESSLEELQKKIADTFEKVQKDKEEEKKKAAEEAARKGQLTEERAAAFTNLKVAFEKVLKAFGCKPDTPSDSITVEVDEDSLVISLTIPRENNKKGKKDFVYGAKQKKAYYDILKKLSSNLDHFDSIF